MFPKDVNIYSVSGVDSEFICPCSMKGAGWTKFYAFFILWNWELLFYSRKNSLGLIVALDYKREAWGELYWDDGVSKGRLSWGPLPEFLREK